MNHPRLLAIAALMLAACSSNASLGGGGYYPGDAQLADGAVGDVTQGSDTAADTAPDTTKPDVTADTTVPPSELTVPGCPDGDYTEAAADPKGDLSAAQAGYSAADAIPAMLKALEARYPFGKTLVLEGDKVALGGGKTCTQAFFNAAKASTLAAALGQASVVVHECGHMLGWGTFGSHKYWIAKDLVSTCQGMSYQGTDASFARSLIHDDAFAAAWPGCASFGMQGCDGYAPIYLDGDPKDGKFDSGDQGYDMVLEEVMQYVNSLAVDYAFADQSSYSTSAEDGLLTFLWYMQRYLHMARLDYPSVYKSLSESPCWRRTTLQLWGRGWFYLQRSVSNPQLNLKGKFLRGLVQDPALLDEIARLRQLEGCVGG
ncbi:MAG: hypothetical protein ACOYOB_08570 [Myxococcota bacterium]